MILPVCADESNSQLMIGSESRLMVGTTPTQETQGIITTAITTAIETIIPEQTIENPIDLNPGITTSGNSQVVLNDGVVTFGGDGVSITTGTVIDGYNFKPSSTVTSGNTLEWQTGEMMWFVVPDPVVKFKYDYNGSVLKETIILKEDRDITFPITIGANNRFESWDGGYRIISNEREDVFSKTWIQVQKPWGIDATGKYIPMEYAYDGTDLNLVYNKEGITYPLTIDPTYYLSGYNSYLKLLLHMNVSPFFDETGKIVANTGVTLSTTTKHLGAGSGYFNISANLSLADSADWTIGTNNFTISEWVYPATSGSYTQNMTMAQSDGSASTASRQHQLMINTVSAVYGFGGVEYGFYNSLGSITRMSSTSGVLPVGKWSQIVVVKSGNTLYLYVNGTQVATQDVTGVTWQDATGILGIGGFGGYSSAYYKMYGYVDEVGFWNGVAIPINELYPQTYETGTLIPLTASFTSSSNPTPVGSTVTFTDTSLGFPTSWNWSFDNRTTWYNGTTQNPTNAFALAGAYNVTLVCNNTAEVSNPYDLTQIVRNLAGDNNQEIVMAPQFALTVHLTDSSTGLPIAVTGTVTDTTNAISNTTIAGTTTLFEDYSIVTGTIVAEGYNPRAFSVVVDSNMEVTYQLTPTTTISPNTNTVYTQHFVSFRIVDMYQKPIQLADINASYIASSLPTGGESSSFLQQAFGVSESVALDMQNGSIAMSGQTTTDGTQTFVMFPALTYKLMVQNDTQGVACQKTISPSDTAYAIYCPTNSQKNPNTTIAQTLNQSYVWVTEPNSSYVTFNSQYQDALAKTTNVRFIVRFASNNSILYQYDFGDPGSAKVLANYTMLNIRGLQMRAALNYTRSV